MLFDLTCERCRCTLAELQLRRAVPLRAIRERARYILNQRAAQTLALFQIQGTHFEDTFATVRLGIEPANQDTAAQDGQHVVPELALRLGCVALDAIIEVEQLAGPRTIPDHRIER